MKPASFLWFQYFIFYNCFLQSKVSGVKQIKNETIVFVQAGLKVELSK